MVVFAASCSTEAGHTTVVFTALVFAASVGFTVVVFGASRFTKALHSGGLHSGCLHSRGGCTAVVFAASEANVEIALRDAFENGDYRFVLRGWNTSKMFETMPAGSLPHVVESMQRFKKDPTFILLCSLVSCLLQVDLERRDG